LGLDFQIYLDRYETVEKYAMELYVKNTKMSFYCTLFDALIGFKTLWISTVGYIKIASA